MKNTILQEVLLISTSTFAKRSFAEKNSNSRQPRSVAEDLEAACWNGLLGDMLPEITGAACNGHSLCLWQIRHARSFLHIDLSNGPVSPDNCYSVDPHYCLAAMNYN